jgi:hypothetical protein
MGDGDYQAVLAAVNRIQRLSDDHWHLLDDSCRAVDDGAWVGPEGRRFTAEVYAQRRELQTQLAKAVHAARAKLQATPRN